MRTLIRWVHIICGLPIIGYVYGAPLEVYRYRYGPRYVFVPILICSALWMWKGHVVRRWFARQSV